MTPVGKKDKIFPYMLGSLEGQKLMETGETSRETILVPFQLKCLLFYRSNWF